MSGLSIARATLLGAVLFAVGDSTAQEPLVEQVPAVDPQAVSEVQAPIEAGPDEPLPSTVSESSPAPADAVNEISIDPPIRNGSGEIAPSAQELIVDDPAVQAQQLLRSFQAALAQGSRDAVLALMASDAVVYDDGQAARSRDDYAQRLLDAELQATPGIQREPVRVDVLGSGDTLWVVQESRLRRTLADIEMSFEETETLILRRQIDGWKIAHRHRSARPLLP